MLYGAQDFQALKGHGSHPSRAPAQPAMKFLHFWFTVELEHLPGTAAWGGAEGYGMVSSSAQSNMAHVGLSPRKQCSVELAGINPHALPVDHSIKLASS